MTYHLFVFDNDLDRRIDLLKKESLCGEDNPCFYAWRYDFYPRFSQGESAHIGLFLLETAEDLINDFNEQFKNIRVDVAFKRKLLDYENGHIKASSNLWSRDLENTKEKTWLYLFTVVFSGEYTNRARCKLFVPIAQFIRILSPSGSYSKTLEYVTYKYEHTVEGLLNGHNSDPYTWGRNGYGTWCSLKVTQEDFLLMDNPKLMNMITDRMDDRGYYGTELYETINEWKRSKDEFEQLPVYTNDPPEEEDYVDIDEDEDHDEDDEN